MEDKLKENDIRGYVRKYYSCKDEKDPYGYFIVTELGIKYNDILLIFKKLGRSYNAISVRSKYNIEISHTINHTVYGGPLREYGECDGILKVTCAIPSCMKNYRLAILQEQKKILNILRSKIECRKASVSAKSDASK